MPSLTPGDRDALLGPVEKCKRGCGVDRIRHYCRTCDEFFITCLCNGPAHFIPPEHEDHRLYLWGPAGVIAVPDFDTFLDMLQRGPRL